MSYRGAVFSHAAINATSINIKHYYLDTTGINIFINIFTSTITNISINIFMNIFINIFINMYSTTF